MSVPDLRRRSSVYVLLASIHEPRIVLAVLTRLRWIAVIGQVAASGVAVFLLHLRLPLSPIAGIICATALSNVLLALWLRFIKPPRWIVQAVLLLDVGLLTALLYLTGGPQNPFASLYLVHVVMAVIVLSGGWAWTVVATVAACYAMLFQWHRPLSIGESLPASLMRIGNWTALVLVSVLMTAFVGRVIRSLRQREDELAEAHERAAQNEQLAALTTLAAGAAHELNTPLGTIAIVARELELTCARGATVGAAAPPEPSDSFTESVRDDARLIRREVDRCRGILGRMRLDIDEDTAHRTQVSLGELEERLRENLRDGEAPRLRIERSPDLSQALLPPRAIEQALLVLVRNAFDASMAPAPVVLGIRRHDGMIRFSVTDQGSGMSPEMLRHVGEPFYTTKEPGQGMGLGLFLVRLLADRCGGSFSIESEPHRGATCALELPERGR